MDELRLLFTDGQEALKTPKKPLGAISPEQFVAFQGQHPPCIMQISAMQNIVERDGKFNYAKMDLARYIVSSGTLDAETLIANFSNNWINDKHNTPEARAKETRAAIKCFEGKSFSCDLAKSSLEVSPCTDCIIFQKKIEETESKVQSSTGIIESKTRYLKSFSDGAVKNISNFRLISLVVYYSEDKPDEIERVAFDVQIVGESARYKKILSSLDFQSKQRFKIAMTGIPFEFIGSDDDLNTIYSMVLAENKIEGVQKMTSIQTLGITRHVKASRGIDEFVWVQEDGSTNGRVQNTVTYRTNIKRNGTNSESSIALNLYASNGQISSHALEVFTTLLECRYPDKIAQFLGFTAACWLKPILQKKPYGDNFPGLQIWGEAGSGKTELTKVFSSLAGADYFSNATKSAAEMTPASARTEGLLTTTIPRIFDEFNRTKMKSDRYDAVRGVIKSSGTKQAMDFMSKNADGSYVQNSNIASTPVITLATNPNEEAEIVQRCETIHLLKSDILDPRSKFCTNFNKIKYSEKEMTEIAGAFMHETLVVDNDWIMERMTVNWDIAMEYINDQRQIKNSQVILMGLDFAKLVFRKRSQTEDSFYEKFDELRAAYIEQLKVRSQVVATTGTRNEIEIALDRISTVAATQINGSYLLSEGVHFIKDIGQLHLRTNLLFPIYNKWVGDQRMSREHSSVSQFMGHLESHDAYVGRSLVLNVLSPNDWITLDLGVLVENGIDVSRFDRA